MQFEEINIRQTPGAIGELQRLGVMATPALEIDGKVIVGFDPQAIDQAVAALGQA